MNIHLRKLICIICTLAALGTMVAVPVSAATTKASQNTATGSTNASSQGGTQGSVQGYGAAAALQNGMVVELNGSTIAPLSSARAGHMFGVTVDPNTLLFTIGNGNIPNEAYVATSGTYPVLVSTEGGTIRSGDYLAISSVDGVAMAVGNSDTTTLGRAVSGFDGKSDSIGSETLKSSNGATVTVALGSIPVAINIARNPNRISTKVDIPKPLQRLGQAIAEKPVSPLRTYLSIAITGISIIMALAILVAGVRNSLIAIGRNPLSKKSIFKGLITVIFTSWIVLIIGLFAVYLLLKL